MSKRDYIGTDEERQEVLYDFLQRRGAEWTPMKSVIGRLDEWYPDLYLRGFHNSNARRMLTRDIEEINSSDRFEKIIISGNYGIKLADKAEFEYFIASEYAEIFRKLKRVRMLAKKGGLDRQCTIEGEIREVFLEGS